MTVIPRPRPPVSRAERFTTDDGRQVLIRPLTSADAPALVAAVARADPENLRRRFMGGVPPTRMLLERLAAADGVHDLAMGAFDDTSFGEPGRLIGVAQFDREGESSIAEVAIEVAVDWQRVGLGTELLHQLTHAALAAGVHTLTASYFVDNVAVRRLLARFAPLVVRRDEGQDGAVDLDLDRLGEVEDLRPCTLQPLPDSLQPTTGRTR